VTVRATRRFSSRDFGVPTGYLAPDVGMNLQVLLAHHAPVHDPHPTGLAIFDLHDPHHFFGGGRIGPVAVKDLESDE